MSPSQQSAPGLHCLLAAHRSMDGGDDDTEEVVGGIPKAPSTTQLLQMLLRKQVEAQKTNQALLQSIARELTKIAPQPRGHAQGGRSKENRAPKRHQSRADEGQGEGILDGRSRLFGTGLRGKIQTAVATQWFKQVRPLLCI